MDDTYYRKKRTKADLLRRWVKSLKKKGVIIRLLIVVPVFSFIMFSNKGVVQRLRLESQVGTLQESIRKAQAEQIKLQQQSKALDADPKAIEKVAREKYCMVREGEIVYKVRREQ